MKIHKSVAVIGLGNISKVHIQALIDQNLEIKYLCDIDISKFEKYKALEKVEFVQDYRDISNVDAVHVCTDHLAHYEISKYFLEKKIDVFCEKIVAVTLDEAISLSKIAKGAGVRLSVCYQNRYNPNIKTIRDLINDKCYGSLLSVYGEVIWNREQAYYENKWQSKKKIAGGGVLATQASHTIDLLTNLLGEFKIIDVDFSFRDKIEVETSAQVKVIFGDVRCLIYSTVEAPFDNDIRLIFNFEKKQIILDGNNLYYKENGRIELISFDGEQACNEKLSWGGYHHLAIEEFHNGSDLLAIETTVLADKFLEEVYKFGNENL